eukprot:g6978.t1
MEKLPNLFPYFERKKSVKYVRLGIRHTIFYFISMFIFLLLWVVLITLPESKENFEANTYPEDYRPGEIITDDKIVPLAKVSELYADTSKREMQCICTNQDPAFEQFAAIKIEIYGFCKNIAKKFDFELCKTFESQKASEKAGYLCPEGLTQDSYKTLESEFLRTTTQAAYSLAHFKELCVASDALLKGFKSGILTETISSPTFIPKKRLQSILKAKFESTLKRWTPMMYASMQHSFGFGRFNTPFDVKRTNADNTKFTDLVQDDKKFYAVSTPNNVLGNDPNQIFSLHYSGGDK